MAVTFAPRFLAISSGRSRVIFTTAALPPGSKRYGLGAYALPQRMVKSLVLHHIDPAAEGIVKIGDESAGEKRRGLRPSFNQQVKIAVRAHPVVRERAEDLHTRHSMPAGDSENALPSGRSKLSDGHTQPW